MITARIKQGLLFLFGKYKKENDISVKEILTYEEFKIFDKMSEYDKIHSFNLYLAVKESEILKDDVSYLKLALLHDCGKENYSLFKRIKKVIIGDKQIEKHPSASYYKLKNIDKKTAYLALKHHEKTDDEKMKEFQRLDDGR